MVFSDSELSSLKYPSFSHWSNYLSGLVAGHRLQHSYLFTGFRGVGKRLTAKAFVTHVFCQEKEREEACGRCLSCRSFQKGAHPDFLPLQKESPEEVTISIDRLRSWLKRLSARPVVSSYRIGYVDNLADIRPDSLTVFLKSVEEPPVHVIFVLVHDQGSRDILPTILSRCQYIFFPPLGTQNSDQQLVRHRPFYFQSGQADDFLFFVQQWRHIFQKRSFQTVASFFRDQFKTTSVNGQQRLLICIDAALSVIHQQISQNPFFFLSFVEELIHIRSSLLQGVPIQPILALENAFLSIYHPS